MERGALQVEERGSTVRYDAERTNRGRADPFWAITRACQRERGPNRSGEAEVGVRVLG